MLHASCPAPPAALPHGCPAVPPAVHAQRRVTIAVLPLSGGCAQSLVLSCCISPVSCPCMVERKI